MSEPIPVRPAATVVVLRDAPGLEVLMVRRHARLAFHGGAWVFPGGRIDPGDREPDADEENAARRAASREAHEEAGLVIDAGKVVPVSRWITPPGLPRRFDTWFFACRAGPEAVRVDGEEIDDHRWVAPARALEEGRAGALELPPPTYVTLLELARHARADVALSHFEDAPTELFVPRPRRAVEGICSLYFGDVAYEGGELERPGPRHRLWMAGARYRYERSPGV